MKPNTNSANLLSAILILIVCAISFSAQTAEQKTNADPQKARFVTSDIDNFWRAFDTANKETDRQAKVDVFEREYFGKGSEGLKDFVQLRIKSAQKLVETIEARPGYYASIRSSTLRVAEMEKRMRKSFANLKKLYPEAVFPDVYFVVGVMNSGGTVSDNGLLIGTEMFGLTKDAPGSELSDWLKANLKTIDAVPHIVAHELIHFQQKYPADQQSVLRYAIAEGSADFIGEKISGQHINPVTYKYGNANEKTLWQEFQTAMNGTSYKEWFGAGAKSRPSDLGYFVGYKITESYYNNAKDKRQAIRDILQVKDFPAFLRQSSYK